MRLAALILAVTVHLHAQITVKLTPEPLEVSRERFGALGSVTLWNARACNNSPETLKVDALRIMMQSDVPLLSKASALAVLRAKRLKRPAVIATNLLEIGGYVAAGALGAQWAPAIVLGRGIGQRIERDLPPVFDVSELLDGTLELAPFGQTGNCIERSVFAVKQRSVKAERFILNNPNGVSAYVGSTAVLPAAGAPAAQR